MHEGGFIWATLWENLFMPYANKKSADQPAHPRSLVSAFVVHCLDSIISILAISNISRLWLASLAAQAGLCRKPRRQVFWWRGLFVWIIVSYSKCISSIYCRRKASKFLGNSFSSLLSDLIFQRFPVTLELLSTNLILHLICIATPFLILKKW